jgi:hypothetical protein
MVTYPRGAVALPSNPSPSLKRPTIAIALAALATLGPPADLSAQIRGGGGMSTSRVISPTVVASWASHQSYSDGSATTLLVLWRGTPGWFSKGAGGSSSGGGGGGSGSYDYHYLSEGGLTFVLEFNYDQGIVTLLNQKISLKEINVVLVDFVDSASGPSIVGYRWVAPAPPEQPAAGDPIAAVVKRTPELFEYLRCDLSLTDPLIDGMIRIICGQMHP